MKRYTIEYKNYLGSVEYSADSNCYFGKILGINDLYLYEGSDTTGLEAAFREAVDEYINNK